MTIIFTKVITRYEIKTSDSHSQGNKDLIARIQTASDNYKSVDFKILQFIFLAVIIAAVSTFSPVGIGIAVATYTAVAVNESVRSYLSIKGIANDFPGLPSSKMLKRHALVRCSQHFSILQHFIYLVLWVIMFLTNLC
jgi:hypothetical protein